jgi:hypothetical protein
MLKNDLDSTALIDILRKLAEDTKLGQAVGTTRERAAATGPGQPVPVGGPLEHGV